MKSTTLLSIASILAYTNAQASSTCQDAAVFNLCMKTQQANLNNCGPVDYACLCQWQKAILTCYNVCYDSASANQAAIQQGVVSSICGAASLAVPSATAINQTSTANLPSQTMVPGPSNSNLPLTSSSVGGANGTSSGLANAKPAPTPPASASGNAKSEGTHLVSGGSAIILFTSAVLYFAL
ncbi:hypothetical protein BGW37DRAFT_476784 [Umbelopsis sp. PMI_123]|nr:hypothetical protein BGW37DRAFT_476784 [Umbelopsis sp. PMI_123]